MRTMTMLLACCLTATASADVQTKVVTYEHDGQSLKGFMAWDDSTDGKRPGVLVVHEWWGLNEYAKKRATMLAEMGYVAFCCDMYGDGQVVEHPKEAGALSAKARAKVESWRSRASLGLEQLKKHPACDPEKTAAIGYCFGGSTALQLALSGSEVNAVVSFHGALPEVTADQAKKIKSKVLICHGAADGFVPEKACAGLREAFEEAGVDYQMVYHGGAKHSFTVEGADEKGIDGIKYDADADRRSWAYMKVFFEETFPPKRCTGLDASGD